MEQGAQFSRGRTHFFPVIGKPIGLVIGNGIVILANVGQHAHQPLELRPVSHFERTSLRRLDQPDDGPALLLNKTVTEFA